MFLYFILNNIKLLKNISFIDITGLEMYFILNLITKFSSFLTKSI